MHTNEIYLLELSIDLSIEALKKNTRSSIPIKRKRWIRKRAENSFTRE